LCTSKWLFFYDGTGDEEDFSVENKKPSSAKKRVAVASFPPLICQIQVRICRN